MHVQIHLKEYIATCDAFPDPHYFGQELDHAFDMEVKNFIKCGCVYQFRLINIIADYDAGLEETMQLTEGMKQLVGFPFISDAG